jgi:hypothetical protein
VFWSFGDDGGQHLGPRVVHRFDEGLLHDFAVLGVHVADHGRLLG